MSRNFLDRSTMKVVIFRLWRLSTASSLVSWLATKTFISALYMNDTMLVTGDNIPMRCTAQWGYAFTKHGVIGKIFLSKNI